MLDEILEQVLGRISSLRIAVVGDLFLDRYLDLDARLTEPSIETGLDAYQVCQVRSYAGAAGTVINNLAALGVRSIVPVAVVGDDGRAMNSTRRLPGWGSSKANGSCTTDRAVHPPTQSPCCKRSAGPPAS